MSDNINLMMFMIFLFMMGMFGYVYHTKICNKYLAFLGFIISGIGLIFTLCIECQIF